jgi:hypothetical protein
MKRPARQKVPFKARGCPWRFYNACAGIDETLTVYDGDIAAGQASDLSGRARRALANHMIALWTAFREESGR